MAIKPITLQDAEFIAHSAAAELLTFTNEPMPPFNTRYPGRLESCLAQPFQTFDGKYLHYTLVERTAVLFYMIAKNQCFVNGNKRMAVTLTLAFLFINKKWMNVDPHKLYELAKLVGESDDEDREEIQKILIKAFKNAVVPLRR
jgi:death-on-curing protein